MADATVHSTFIPLYKSFHESLILITSPRKPPLNAHVDVSSGTRGLNVGSSLHTHPHVAYASNVGCGESVHLHMLALTFVARQCDKYQTLMCWLIQYIYKMYYS